MKKLKKVLAGLTIAGAVTLGMTIPVAASAAPVSTQGAIVCHTVGTKHNPPASCWFTPSNPSCVPYWTYKRVCD